MKKRFEIPLTPGDGLKEINLFAVDDYLREMATEGARRKLIATAGVSAETRAAYEQKNGLPRGAVELVILMEDKRIKELDRMITARAAELLEPNPTPEAVEDFYRAAFSIGRGMQQLYPEASEFMLQYSLLSQRNRQRFLGDYGFSNEYKIQNVAWCFPSCDGGQNCPVNINVGLNINIGLNINVVALVNVAAANKVVLVVLIWICLGVIPGPLFGLPFQMSDEQKS